MTTDTMRAEFEAWANEREMHIGWDAEEEEYQSYPTHTAWLAWQASAEAERGRVIEECAKVAEKTGWALMPDQLSYEVSRIASAIRALNRTAAQQEKPE
jgi:hypothetical protein